VEKIACAMIILCEPQCVGFEHAAFNAALLVATDAAFPDDEILFFCEASHRREIENALRQTQAPPVRAAWREAEIPAPQIRGLRRLRAERALVETVLAQAGSTPDVRGILFCSATEITILVLKQSLRKIPAPCGVSVVLHGVLRSLEEPRWRKPWRWGFSLRQALKISHPPNLNYIALGESIRVHAVRAELSLKKHLRAMEMPRLWNPAADSSRDDARVHFGFFGSTAKGFSHFYEMAQALKNQNSNADFSLVGFLNGRDLERDYDEKIVSGLSRAPLAQQEYSRRGARVDYAVWPANPTHYRLTASASFLDALDYLKPIIYLANPYVDFYFEKLGDIGYRCETLAEMQTTIADIAREFPAERYQRQCAAMLRGRERFEPSSVAPTLKAILRENS
jgi:hypothetical protein